MTDRSEVIEGLKAVNCVSVRETLSRHGHLRLTPRLLRESVRMLRAVGKNGPLVETHHFED
jgi:hypothetical protein